jgi:hypothetical protein
MQNMSLTVRFLDWNHCRSHIVTKPRFRLLVLRRSRILWLLSLYPENVADFSATHTSYYFYGWNSRTTENDFCTLPVNLCLFPFDRSPPSGPTIRKCFCQRTFWLFFWENILTVPQEDCQRTFDHSEEYFKRKCWLFCKTFELFQKAFRGSIWTFPENIGIFLENISTNSRYRGVF